MRLKDREITDFDEMTAVLDGCDCCRIGLTDDDGCAYIVPMNFGYVASAGSLTLYFHSAREGKKLDLLKKCGKASFEADTAHKLVSGARACDCTFAYASVMGKGTVSEADGAEKLFGLERLTAHYAPSVPAVFSEKYVKAASVLVFKVTEWTCKVNKG